VFNLALARASRCYARHNQIGVIRKLKNPVMIVERMQVSGSDSLGISGGSKNFERGGVGGRQFISSVFIYRKCAQRNICLLHGKSGFLEKNMSQ